MRYIVIFIMAFSLVFADIVSSVTTIVSALTSSDDTVYREAPQEFQKINPDDVTNIYGNLQITGNTITCITTKDSVDNVTLKDYQDNYKNFSCTEEIDTNNNHNIVKLLDEDNDNNTYDSSIAYLKLPTTYKEIVWAGLFWQGQVNDYSEIYELNGKVQYSSDYTDYNKKVEDTPVNKIKIKINDSDYDDVTANIVDYTYDSTKVKINGKKTKLEGFEYSAYANVTDLFKDKDFKPGTKVKITVADLFTSRGIALRHGNYGAWSLVIIYKEDPNNPLSKLRNNSVYYGYDHIYNGKIDLYIDHLVLPNKKGQKINSYMALFSAEGEHRYGPDYALLNDQELNETLTHDGKDVFEPNNVFDSRLSDEIEREPDLYNTNGIDIDVFNNASEIMEKMRDDDPGELYYKVKITIQSGPDSNEFSSMDTIYPSVVVFSTELYEPRVCYYIDTIEDENGNIVFENGNFVKDIDPNKEYKINLWISNMKKSQDDEDLDTAKKVKVFMNMNDFNYTLESTQMKNIGDSQFNPQTDKSGDDLFTYIVDDLQGQYHVGEEASASEGGTIDVASSFDDDSHKAFISFKGKFNTSDDQSQINLDDYFEFKASFATDFMTIDENNAVEISKCVPFDASANIYIPQSGTFNVVEPM